MVSIARKNLFHDWTRFLVSVGGVAFAVFLMLFITGIYNGFEEVLVNYVKNQDVDIWVLSKTSDELIRGDSFLPLSLISDLESHSGVKSVNKMAGSTVKFTVQDENVSLVIRGYDTDSGVGGPWRILAGKSKPDKGEIIIDTVFARKNNIELNQILEIIGERFRVVGISGSTNILIWQYAFTTYEDARRLFGLQNQTNFILIKAVNPEFSQSLADDIAHKYGVNAFVKAEFIENNRKFIREGFRPIIFSILIIAVIVGTAFVVLTVYTITVEKMREYGILKAIGASNNQLYKIIFEQSLTSAVIGFLVGSLITILVTFFTWNVIPQLTISLRPASFIAVLGASIGMSLLASYAPIKKVSEVDPLLIFRG